MINHNLQKGAKMFDKAAAMQEYIKNSNMTYKRLAEKYGVSASSIGIVSRKENWKEKRREYQKKHGAENSLCSDKLALLKKSSDKAIEALYGCLDGYEELSINELKNVSAILKTLTAVQRDLNNLPTFKEENNIRITNERLKLVRERIISADENEDECGIVFIPFADEEDDESVVYEGDEDV